MRIKILSVTVLCFFLFQGLSAQENDIVENIATYFRNSNSSKLSQNFASTVDLTIINEEDVYSRVQAEIILENFFKKRNPTSVKVIHRLNSNPNYRFGVLIMNTDKGKFRVSFSMKDTSGKFLITEIQIKTAED